MKSDFENISGADVRDLANAIRELAKAMEMWRINSPFPHSITHYPAGYRDPGGYNAGGGNA